jgi:hypothetical protein
VRIVLTFASLLLLSACTPDPQGVPAAPPVTDVCAHVDDTLVGEILGGPRFAGENTRLTPGTAGIFEVACNYPLSEGVLQVQVAAVPVEAARRGGKACLAAAAGTDEVDRDRVDGAGDYAVYTPLNRAFRLTLYAVKRMKAGWYAVGIVGFDNSADRHLIGKATEEQWAELAGKTFEKLGN